MALLKVNRYKDKEKRGEGLRIDNEKLKMAYFDPDYVLLNMYHLYNCFIVQIHSLLNKSYLLTVSRFQIFRGRNCL